ncbi:prominin-like protein isoform X2 [Aricia agestis]|uniref:prominin-like protein isoform X2 n=1 Tax=Aricia agestis TaxID=91739 RepID=UPI001C20A2FE|nr:prominin-like protein isoform X2 [Aricia agestis]
MWRVVVWCALLGGAHGQLWLSNMTDNLRSGMAAVMEAAAVNYSEPVLVARYVSRLDFDMRAMGHLYNSSHLVIDLIARKDAYPEGVVSVSDGHVEFSRDQWRALLAHYAGPAAVVAAALLLAALMPLAGLLWCCCQWCRSSRRRRPFDRKYDGCLKAVLAILLIGLLTLLLFGVVCAFVTDAQLEASAATAPDAAAAGLRDARTFLNASAAHARHLLVDNYGELRAALAALLDSGGRTVLRQLDEWTSATSVRHLSRMVEQLARVPGDLRTVHNHTVVLRARAERLNAGLRRVKSQLLRTLADCREPQCVQLQDKYKIGQLDTDIQYNKIPDVSALLHNVSVLVEGTMREDVRGGLSVFDGIKRTVDQHIPRVHTAIADTGDRLRDVADQIAWAAGNQSAKLADYERGTDELRGWLGRYGGYRRWATRAAAAALLAVVALLALGLLCGVCGKRPDAYGAADCCNKGTGATCLLCGVALTFAVAAGVALALLAYFAVGVASQRLVCDPLAEPRGNRVWADVERFVQLERAMYGESVEPDFNLTSVLVECHANRTLYRALHLRRRFDLDELQERARAALAEQVAALRTDYPPRGRPLRILPPAARDKLIRLGDTGLSEFDFDRILHALETNMTSLSLDGLAGQLRSTAGALAGRPGFADVARELRAAADDLQRLHADVVQPMLRQVADLDTIATELRDVLRFNQSSLKEAIQYRLRDASEVELFLNTQGPDLVQNLTREFAEAVGARLQAYLARVAHAAEHDVARCGPLSHAFNTTRDHACKATLLPINGFWMSVAWCVVLWVPLMVLAPRLARLYRHADPYPGPLVEAEYLYDAYADRDNVPLANAYKAEKRAGRSGGGGGGGAGEGVAGPAPRAALAPPVDAHHARRYNDMAPKHWEEGPPRYHGPTEYERPPPYYYPGPHDRE